MIQWQKTVTPVCVCTCACVFVWLHGHLYLTGEGEEPRTLPEANSEQTTSRKAGVTHLEEEVDDIGHRWLQWHKARWRKIVSGEPANDAPGKATLHHRTWHSATKPSVYLLTLTLVFTFDPKQRPWPPASPRHTFPLITSRSKCVF